MSSLLRELGNSDLRIVLAQSWHVRGTVAAVPERVKIAEKVGK